MPKSNNNRKKSTKKKAHKSRTKQKKTNQNKISWPTKLNKYVLWAAATGLLGFVCKQTYSYFTGDVKAQYVKNVGRGYEFKLVNNSSTDQIVESFRILPDFDQEFAFKINKPIHGVFSHDGVSIPGGNKTYMPAYEFKGADNRIIKANSSISFKIPPLSARDYVVPESMVVYLKYQTRSANDALNKLENALKQVGLSNSEKKDKYFISENYWMEVDGSANIDAIQELCRDNDAYSSVNMCKDK